MKKVVMSIALAGLVSSVGAADLGSKDAAFLFGNSNVHAVAMSGAEMAATEGRLLEILMPLVGVVTGLPIVGPILGSLLGQMPVGPLMGTANTLLGTAGAVTDLLPAVVGSALPVKLAVGLDLGALLNINTGVQVNSALPSVLGSATGVLL